MGSEVRILSLRPKSRLNVRSRSRSKRKLSRDQGGSYGSFDELTAVRRRVPSPLLGLAQCIYLRHVRSPALSSQRKSAAILRLPHIGLPRRRASTASARVGDREASAGRLGRRDSGSLLPAVEVRARDADGASGLRGRQPVRHGAAPWATASRLLDATTPISNRREDATPLGPFLKF